MEHYRNTSTGEIREGTFISGIMVYSGQWELIDSSLSRLQRRCDILEKAVVHSRFGATVNIINVAPSRAIFRGVVVEFELLDLSAAGVNPDETIYALYLDRIFIKEHSGNNRIAAQLYGESVSVVIEVFALPYGGFRPVLDSLSANDRNRLKVSWRARNPDSYDVSDHVIYWDNKTGTIIDVPIAVIDAETGIGGGDKVDVSRITN